MTWKPGVYLLKNVHKDQCVSLYVQYTSILKVPGVDVGDQRHTWRSINTDIYRTSMHPSKKTETTKHPAVGEQQNQFRYYHTEEYCISIKIFSEMFIVMRTCSK